MYYCYLIFLNECICARFCASAYSCGATLASHSRYPFWQEAGGAVIFWYCCFQQQAALVCKLTSFSFSLPSAAFCSSQAKCHVLSLAWCCPDGLSLIRHCHVSVSMLSTICRAFPALTLPSLNEKAVDCSTFALVMAHWRWPVTMGASGKAWWGQSSSQICVAVKMTWGSVELGKWLVSSVSGAGEMGMRYYHILSDIVVKFMHLAEVSMIVYQGARDQELL